MLISRICATRATFTHTYRAVGLFTEEWDWRLIGFVCLEVDMSSVPD